MDVDNRNDVEVEEGGDPEAPLSFSSKLSIGLLLIVALPFIFHYGVKTFRNADHRELSERFIRSSDVIRNEVGEITRIGSGKSVLSGNGEWEVQRTVLGSRSKVLVTTWMHCSTGNTDVGVGCTIQRAKWESESVPKTEAEIPISWSDKFWIVYR